MLQKAKMFRNKSKMTNGFLSPNYYYNRCPKQVSSYGGREGGIGGLVGGFFMRGNKSKFLRQSTLYSLS